MPKPLKRALLVLLLLALAIVLFAAGFIAFLTVTEYKPADTETVDVLRTPGEGGMALSTQEGVSLRILSWNIGYGGLGQDADFFMDGGSGVRAKDRETVEENLSAISGLIRDMAPDFVLLQEVDAGSTRTFGIDERERFSGAQSAFALNYCCRYVPYPIPTIGRVNSGLYTLTDHAIASAARQSLPCPFSWPVSAANLKRCLLVNRVDLEGTDRQLVLVDLHLEAYDSGEGKLAQTAALNELLDREYAAGNYVIAGGDFNQTFPGALDVYPIKNPELWTPGVLLDSDLREGWRYAYDLSTPSCRLLNQPYDPSDTANTQYYVIDGFILSPNVRLEKVETVDLGFALSDHNPVLLQVTLG